MHKRHTMRHLIIAIALIVALMVVMYSSIVLRDYNISFSGGPHLESKISVPGPPGFGFDTGTPEKLAVRITANSADAWDVQISRFSNMAFAKTHRVALPRKDVGLMKGGRTYYVRVRSVIKKPGTNRRVFGVWGPVKPVTIREKPKN